MPAVSPGAPVPAPEYVDWQFKERVPKTLLDRFGPRAKSDIMRPALDFDDFRLNNSGKNKTTVYRVVNPLRNPSTGDLIKNYKADIRAGDWVSTEKDFIKRYQTSPDSQIIEKRVNLNDLYTRSGFDRNPFDKTKPADIHYFSTDTLDGVDGKKFQYAPRGTKLVQNRKSDSPDLYKPVEKKALIEKSLKKAVYPKGPEKPMTKPGMVTGRMPMIRGFGGGIIDMFMEGPELQKAKTDPLYGVGSDERAKIEAAYEYGL